MFDCLLPIVQIIIQLNQKEFHYVQIIDKILTLVDNVSMTELLILYVDAMCKESQFYSVPFGQALASIAQPKSHLRYQPPFRTVHARIAVALVVFIKTPINHIFFNSLIIPDFGFELTKTIYLNVFRNWIALCKSTRLYKSCSIPAGNKRKKTINTAFTSQHVPLKNRVSDF